MHALLDNCDTRGHHSTVAYTQVETMDTTHLSMEALPPEEVMGIFHVGILNLSTPGLEDELKHFKYVAMLALGRYMAERNEELAHWKQLLVVHHRHPASNHPLQEAHVRLESLLHYQVFNSTASCMSYLICPQETVSDEMIEMLLELKLSKLLQL